MCDPFVFIPHLFLMLTGMYILLIKYWNLSQKNPYSMYSYLSKLDPLEVAESAASTNSPTPG